MMIRRHIPNAPLAATAQWRAAVLAANLACQCHRGECGKAHRDTGGKCDAHLSEHAATRLHLVVDEKRGEIVVCGDCLDGRKTIANRKAKAAPGARREDFAIWTREEAGAGR